MTEVNKISKINPRFQWALTVCLFVSSHVFALDFSYDPDQDSNSRVLYLASAQFTSPEVISSFESRIEDEIMFHERDNSEDQSSTATNNERPTAIRLDFSEAGQKEKGWKLTPALELRESMAFKDCREAVQWADNKNQPSNENASLDKTLEKFGISFYRINLLAEYLF